MLPRQLRRLDELLIRALDLALSSGFPLGTNWESFVYSHSYMYLVESLAGNEATGLIIVVNDRRWDACDEVILQV